MVMDMPGTVLITIAFEDDRLHDCGWAKGANGSGQKNGSRKQADNAFHGRLLSEIM